MTVIRKAAKGDDVVTGKSLLEQKEAILKLSIGL